MPQRFLLREDLPAYTQNNSSCRKAATQRRICQEQI